MPRSWMLWLLFPVLFRFLELKTRVILFVGFSGAGLSFVFINSGPTNLSKGLSPSKRNSDLGKSRNQRS